MNFCLENLAIYRDGAGRLCDILTGDETWIYHRQISRKASNACWIGEGERPKTIVRRDRYEPKTHFSIFFRTTGPVLIHAISQGKTIDSKYYIENCLTPAFNEIKKQRKLCGTRNIRLLHDNAKPHTSILVNNFLKEEGVELVKHPSYSPDLAPCDFYLFDYIKRNLEDQPDANSLERAVTKIMYDLPIQEYKYTFDKWIERLELCVENKGEYFEHLIK